MDKDNDQNLSYNEFCAFTEEKRRNIDPFEDDKYPQPLNTS